MLAEGADRLVARAVLDYNNTSSLEVVLPFSLSEYKKTFKNPNDKEFVELFQKAKRIISTETITRYSEQNLSEYIKTHPYESKELPGKNDAFKSAGMYMVDNSDLLIALWDGKTNHGKGGTKDIIDYAKEKGVSIIIIYTDADRPNKIMQGQSFLKLT